MKNLSLIGLLLLVFFSCRNDIDENGSIKITQDPPIIINEYDPTSELVSGTIYGRVYDENEVPVENALVKYAGKTFSTDAEGRFLIEDETLDRQGTFFTVEADGFFRGSRRIYPQDGSVNYAYVQLLALDEIDSFNAADGGEIIGDDGLRITFNANSIQSSTGGLYNGEVTVAAKWLDPTAPNIAEIMPGDLLGLNTRVEEVSLVTYGMMAVELFDENGNNINLAEGSTATLSFPVPQELINEAPAKIPLWSFEDQQFGIWAEEGTASLQGNRYVGQVSHFSFWNCDSQFPLVDISGQLMTEDGRPLSNTTICICAEESNSRKCSTTDNRGFFIGKVPQDQDLVLKFGLQGQDCEFNSINLGSFSTDKNIGSIQVTELEAAFSIIGTIIDCNSNPVTNGLVNVQIGNIQLEYFTKGDGSFDIAILNCANASEISISVVDIDNLEEGTQVSLPISPEVNFGAVIACGTSIEQFFTLTVDGQSGTHFEVLDVHFRGTEPSSLPELRREINFMDSITVNRFQLLLKLESGLIGSYDLSDSPEFFVSIFKPTFKETADLRQLFSFEISITENGGIGGYWAGEFSGIGLFESVDDTFFEAPFSGKFRAPILE